MTPDKHLVIFTRYPSFGRGKRRLAADAGPTLALRFQRVMLRLLLLGLGRDGRWRTWLAVTPDRSGPWPRHVRALPQKSGDLGQRMERIARALPSGPMVIVGSDCPAIRSSHIAQAFRALGSHDAVFGPAADGGYWLIGLRRRARLRMPFDGVRWSTEHALSDTVANLADRPVAMLQVLDDVDDAASLARHPAWNILNAAQKCPGRSPEAPEFTN